MKTLIPLFMTPLIFASHAEQIQWTAAGSVSSVNGSGFTAANDDPVSVKFSYDSGATPQGLTELFERYARFGFHGNIGLSMEVKIGENTWKGAVATVAGPPRAAYPIVSDAWSVAYAPDVFTVTATSADSADFDPFPYTGAGAGAGKSIQVVLRDGTIPSHFLDLGVLPSETTPVSEITLASGSITAGSDSIQFSIDPATVSVTSDAPKFPLTITRTLTGIELRWPSEAGVTYQLQDSDALTGWQFYGMYPGTGSDIVVTLNPFDDHPERRFYRVITQ